MAPNHPGGGADDDDDEFEKIWSELTGNDVEEPVNRSQLLGWPDVIQNSMFEECDLVSPGIRT